MTIYFINKNAQIPKKHVPQKRPLRDAIEDNIHYDLARYIIYDVFITEEEWDELTLEQQLSIYPDNTQHHLDLINKYNINAS